MRMSIGVVLSGLHADRAKDLPANARHAEGLGLDALFVGDHLFAPGPVLDSTLTLATAAAVTERIGLGFGVMVPALRGPVRAAKQVATLQVLSGDRVILGVGSGGDPYGGAGWEAAGVPYADRGRLTDAALAVLPDLIAGKPTRVDGADVAVTLAPGASVPPIWVGGNSAVARRRAAEHATGWFPSMRLPADVARGARHLAELAEARDRPRPDIAIGGAVLLGDDPPPALLDDFAHGVRDYGIPAETIPRLPITGPPARAAERLAEYAEAGATHAVLGVIGDDWQRQCELLAETRALLSD